MTGLLTLRFRLQILKGGDFSAGKRIFLNNIYLDRLLLSKKHPILGIHINNAGDYNQSCQISTVIFNLIESLQVP